MPKTAQPIKDPDPAEQQIIDHPMPNTQVGKVYKVEGFYFGFNKTTVYSGETERLDVLYKLLLNQPHLSVQIQAYTDCRGNAAVNKRVAMQRAASYKKYLQKREYAEAA
jgi:outer membrane protein OmpA-like peptidoglycan-associated protein